MFKNKKICRTCLETESELISTSAIVEAENRIIDYFMLYLNFPMSAEDELPQSICMKCLGNLLDVKKFHLQCKENEIFLQEKIIKDEFNSIETVTVTDLYSDASNSIETQGIPSQDLIIESLPDDFIESYPCEESNATGPEDIIEYVNLGSMNLAETDFIQQEEFKCNVCDDSFKYEKNLKMHNKFFHNWEEKEPIAVENQVENPEDPILDDPEEKIRSRKSVYQCEICDCGFRFKRNYSNHMKRHRMDPKYKCLQCKKTFFLEKSMHKHFTNTHVVTGSDESCLCPICGAQFSSKKYLGVHMQTHNANRKRYSCEICGKSFLRKDSRITHMRTHTGERPFECEICKKRFTQRNALTTHMTLHTGKPVKCPLCDKTFSRKSFLKVHNREHTDERPYACDLCPKRYRQKTHLVTHQYVHFDKRPFACEICGKAFSQNSTLKQHKFIHVGKPFKCPECTMTFVRPWRFRQHLANAHNNYDDVQKYKTQPNTSNSSKECTEILETDFLSFKNFEDNNGDELEIDITNL